MRPATGATALGEVILTRPDAVVLDLRMPGVDGWETLRLLREWSPRSRVVVYTAEPCPDVPALEAEFGAYVVRKGDGLDTLAQVPADWLGGGLTGLSLAHVREWWVGPIRHEADASRPG